MSARSARKWLEVALFTVAKWKFRYMPEPIALWFGGVLGWFVGRVLGVRWSTVTENLALAFPDRSPEWRDRIAEASYRHLGREAVAVLRMSWMSADEIIARTRVEGLDEFRAALAQGNGVILATGHLGSWEVGAACLAARGVPVDGVTKRMSNERFGRKLEEIRNRLGYRSVDTSESSDQVPRSLAEGRMVALLGDQNVRRGGVFVPFFGREASTARGVALFALRTGAPVFLGVAVHEPGRPHSYRGILRRIPVEATGDRTADIRRITADHARVLEELVREYPEQYFWQHRRWGTRPPVGESGTSWGRQPGPGPQPAQEPPPPDAV